MKPSTDSSPRPGRLGALFAAFAAFLFVSTSAADGTKVGTIDLQGALLQTEDGMSAAATLKNYTQKRQGDLDGRQRALQKEQDDLQKQSRVLSRAALMRRTEHWQRRMVEVQTKFIEYNKQLQQKQAEFMQPIMQKLFGVVRRVASAKGFDIVVDKAAVPYSRADLDITDMVVQKYNASGGVKGGDDGGGDDKKK
ncbi:MAG TPA: OmpH family outer membrane protein [Polyangiaceae bacterium]|nr:OmpH family outer membrane protein [Polyangiaceae bacterium]